MKRSYIIVASAALAVLILLAIKLSGIFTGSLFSTQVRLERTMNKLDSILEVEELISTEYYGEVFVTLKDAYEDLKRQLPVLYGQLEHELVVPALNDSTGPALRFSPDSCRSILSRKYAHLETYRTLFWGYSRNPDKVLGDLLNQTQDEFIKTKLDRLKGIVKSQQTSSKLSLIARGKTRAYFNLATVKDSILSAHILERDTTYIHLGLLSPQIVTAINPWFIYRNEQIKEGVPGYQVVNKDAGQDRMNYRRIQLLRVYAEKMLQEQAIELGLEERARESLLSTLEGLLNMMTGKTVVFKDVLEAA